ncbi:hypothetical protein B0H14DRAFT_3464096 [Mycena olivaceomarginata]|nr:hypothetical protein B0H14DRAFT_3464096 [Mycena olivaceomarginata]
MFFTCLANAWVEGCDQLKIPIKAKEAAKFVDAYREAFVDAIVEFIVSDDQEEMVGAIGMISTTMDLWSDRNKTPFMAVTCHWLQATLIDTPAGP